MTTTVETREPRETEIDAIRASIADIAAYPWIVAAWEPFTKMMPDEVAKLPRLKAWIDRLAVRPAVERGMAVPPGD